MNEYMIIIIDNEGNKTASEFFHSNTYDGACALQELLDLLHPENAHLIYTADEWMYECENNA